MHAKKNLAGSLCDLVAATILTECRRIRGVNDRGEKKALRKCSQFYLRHRSSENNTHARIRDMENTEYLDIKSEHIAAARENIHVSLVYVCL